MSGTELLLGVLLAVLIVAWSVVCGFLLLPIIVQAIVG